MSQDNGLKSEFRRSSTAHPFGGPVAWIPRAEASELLTVHGLRLTRQRGRGRTERSLIRFVRGGNPPLQRSGGAAPSYVEIKKRCLLTGSFPVRSRCWNWLSAGWGGPVLAGTGPL